MTPVGVPLLAQPIEDDAYRWLIDAAVSGFFEQVRFPSTVNALPTVTDEALDAELAVVLVVTTDATCRA